MAKRRTEAAHTSDDHVSAEVHVVKVPKGIRPVFEYTVHRMLADAPGYDARDGIVLVGGAAGRLVEVVPVELAPLGMNVPDHSQPVDIQFCFAPNYLVYLRCMVNPGRLRFGNDTVQGDETTNVMTSRVIHQLAMGSMGRIWSYLFADPVPYDSVDVGHWEVEARGSKIQRVIIGVHYRDS